jgi:hypothetical protein
MMKKFVLYALLAFTLAPNAEAAPKDKEKENLIGRTTNLR